jgi:hypothetical protein
VTSGACNVAWAHATNTAVSFTGNGSSDIYYCTDSVSGQTSITVTVSGTGWTGGGAAVIWHRVRRGELDALRKQRLHCGDVDLREWMHRRDRHGLDVRHGGLRARLRARNYKRIPDCACNVDADQWGDQVQRGGLSGSLGRRSRREPQQTVETHKAGSVLGDQ